MQIVTGIVLVMHLRIDTRLIFSNVNYINQDIVYGFFLRAIHTNGASFVFVFLYFYMFRDVYHRPSKGRRLAGVVTTFRASLLAVGRASLVYMLMVSRDTGWFT